MMAQDLANSNKTVSFEGLLPLLDTNSKTDTPIIIAGPCSAESAESVIECAQRLHEQGVKYFRAGLWKPRTRPGAFEGVGAKGLSWLKRVKAFTGMKVLTEVGNAVHTSLAVKAGIDCIWLGARTVANPFAVQEIADQLKRMGAMGVSVLVKNPVNPDLDLWIGALERLYSAGVRRLGAVHRGFSSYAPGRWRNPPQWAIPIELHRRLPEVPLLHDPSHCSGNAHDVPGVALKAMRMCFNGLMIECHLHPQFALSDAAQQITPSQLGELLRSLPQNNIVKEGNYQLSLLRGNIDELDTALLQILAQRMECCRQIGELKQAEGLPILQPQRYAALVGEKVKEGEKLGLSPEFLQRLFSEIHAASVDLQLNLPISSKSEPATTEKE